jgi:hypothetical protein
MPTKKQERQPRVLGTKRTKILVSVDAPTERRLRVVARRQGITRSRLVAGLIAAHVEAAYVKRV